MNTLCQAVDDHLELRRALGFKLVKYGACLQEFRFVLGTAAPRALASKKRFGCLAASSLGSKCNFGQSPRYQ
jgi:hypothetical protein